MKYTLIPAFLLLGLYAHAQDIIPKQTNLNNDSLTSMGIEAKFTGGQETWLHFLEKNIHNDVPAQKGAKPGNYTVTISFLVDTTGKISDVEVLNDPGYGTAEDVLKAFKHCPNWQPATINGKPVIYRQKQNITYQVTEN